MSTLVWRLAGTIAPASESKTRLGFWTRLINARQAQADRKVRAYLTGIDDASLKRLGFREDDVRALRSGATPRPWTSRKDEQP